MTITAVQEGGASAGNAASVAHAFASNVTAGNRVIIGCAGFINGAGSDALQVSDISSSGTATLGSWTLHAQGTYTGTSGNFRAAVFSATVTGTGSLTVTFGSQPAGSYLVIGAGEYTNIGLAVAATATASEQSGTTADSGNATVSGAGLLFGIGTFNPSAFVDPTITEDGAFTLVYEEQDVDLNQPSSIIRRINTGAALTDSASWSLSLSCQYGAALVAFAEASSSRLAGMGCGR